MTGAASRRRGHNAERAVVKYLRERGYSDAYTTRSKLGHDGAHAPGDVVGPVGLVIEVKDVAASSWPSWCRQAHDESQGRAWVVVRKVRGIADPGKWLTRCWLGWDGQPTVPLARFLDWWESDSETGRFPS